MNRRTFLSSLALSGMCIAHVATVEAQQTVAANAIKVHFKDIHCEGCAKKIRSRIFTVAGVSKVETSVSKDLAIVTPISGRTLSAKDLWESLDQGKFDVSKMETPDGTLTEKPTT